ncbi:specifically androgen-regulated gene protein-like [Brienomyrus brachyistius]|uniref:specifically androgen-regulated gene protein-like n=1 Tax=Brienomyrus brachyistius TaxID=42636 RepID=UPI0020B3423F|nr:specifically androgen-regulated gene protein-like [Brienomyrus brachyistius]XP_048840150.1 specifically androgen-regulated gene protein-like [Brienomyrus brachyistius]XP_048840151.1 specifically androgen-regulated gene protein-like [Brienomyrus brachyistius]XP_048840152.1 specifically androgen-regulated gene protein-like [Brienomyrus brachyistius]
MPKSAAWPGSMTVERIPSSPGSCDSAVSLGPAISNGSLEDLSAAERECLMFLEETIESLEAEEDHASSSITDSSKFEIPAMSWSLDPPEWEGDGGTDLQELRDPLPPATNMEHGDRTIQSEDPGVDVSPLKATQLNTELPDQPRSTTESQNHEGQDSVPPEVSLELIPPPLDFRDDPLEQKDPVIMGPLSHNDLQELQKRASLKKSPPVSPDPKGKPLPEHTLNVAVPSSPTEVVPMHELGEQKSSPPMVAPKPKKLPSNIILKSHKTPGPSQDSATPTNCITTSPSERVLMDPQKVRMEALRKIGLLKADDVECGVAHSPGHSPKSYRFFQLPTPPISPSSTFLQSSDVNIVPESASTFKELHEARDRPALPGGHQEQVNKPVNFPGVKSASFERSPFRHQAGRASFGSHQGPSKANGNGSLSSEHNSRPRPASLGNRHDLKGNISLPNTDATASEVRDSEKVSPQYVLGPSKLPRSQGVSVVISPHGDVGEARREALRKLGLLKH